MLTPIGDPVHRYYRFTFGLALSPQPTAVARLFRGAHLEARNGGGKSKVVVARMLTSAAPIG
jgi:hypothetical protein